MNVSLSNTQVDWVKKYARFGYASKGAVYCLTGVLAFLAAIGNGSTRDTGRKTVINTIMEQPMGAVLLTLVAIGLVGYVVWRFIEAIKDPHNHGKDVKGILVRIGYFFSALVYLSISWYAFEVIWNGFGGKDDGGESQRTMVDKVLGLPFGQWIIGAIGVGILIRGIQQIIKGLSGKYLKNLRSYLIDNNYRNLLIKIGAVGCVARGLIWVIIGFLFVKSAVNTNSQEVGGTENALGYIVKGFGTEVLGAMAIGLLCYGIFKILQAIYLRLPYH